MKTKLMNVLLLLILTTLLIPAVASAGVGDNDKPLFSLTPWGGATFWSEDAGLKDGSMFGGRAAILMTRHLSLEGGMGWSSTEFSADNSSADVRHDAIDLVFDLAPRAKVNPYILGGWSRLNVSDDASGPTIKQEGWEAAIGMKWRLGGDNVNRRDLRLEIRDVMNDAVTGRPELDDINHNLIVSAGLQFHFGHSSKDTDNDGVRNKADTCAETPAGAIVDLAGCPVDSDSDGVFDGIDQCADTPAGAVIDSRGCPLDSDGDGVFDGLDNCPYTPVNLFVDDQGCPMEITETVEEILDTGMIHTSDVRFSSGSVKLKTNDTAKLDEIGQTLSHWPELRVELGGHTDSQGSAAFNQTLSEKRAQTVLGYIVAKYPTIHAEQYTVVGYGEVAPIAENDNAEGRAVNRRVEFKVLNTDVIKRVNEHRKLMERSEER